MIVPLVPDDPADISYRNRTVGSVVIFGVTPDYQVVQDYRIAYGDLGWVRAGTIIGYVGLLGGIIGILFGAGTAVVLKKAFGWTTSIGISSIVVAFFFAAIVGVVLLMPRGILGLLQTKYRLPRTI